MAILAPIALFVYKRPLHTKRVLNALAANQLALESDLIVFCDGAKKSADEQAVFEVRDICSRANGFRSVRLVCQQQNLGLAKSIIQGVTQVVQESGRVIVLEDDLITSPYFLTYMNQALDLYADDQQVASIHGYIEPLRVSMPETFFLRGADCWGWATWSRAWAHFNPDGQALLNRLIQQNLTELFDFDGSAKYTEMLRAQICGANDSWAIRWLASAFLDEMLTLYPGKSLVKNIGMDGSGTHSTPGEERGCIDKNHRVNVQRLLLQNNSRAYQEYARYFRSQRGFRAQILYRILNLFR